MPSQYQKLFFLTVFSMSTAWVDVIALSKYGVFANMMVGNMIYLGRVLGAYGSDDPKWQSETKIPPLFLVLVLFDYMLGVVLFQLSQHYFKFDGRHWGGIVFVMLVSVELLEYYIGIEDNVWLLLLIVWVFGAEDTLCLKGVMQMLPWGSTGKVVAVGVTMSKTVLGIATVEEMKKGVVAFLMTSGMVVGACLALLYCRWNENSPAFGNAIVAPLLGFLLLLHDSWLKDQNAAEQKDHQNKNDALTAGGAAAESTTIAIASNSKMSPHRSLGGGARVISVSAAGNMNHRPHIINLETREFPSSSERPSDNVFYQLQGKNTSEVAVFTKYDLSQLQAPLLQRNNKEHVEQGSTTASTDPRATIDSILKPAEDDESDSDGAEQIVIIGNHPYKRLSSGTIDRLNRSNIEILSLQTSFPPTVEQVVSTNEQVSSNGNGVLRKKVRVTDGDPVPAHPAHRPMNNQYAKTLANIEEKLL
ncbi:unnamed protein product [Amoebophrya sp. A120]|nr:unnamed protein product [Amoebophrya sp. A120]|eukprot:GSA120T00000820001.1